MTRGRAKVANRQIRNHFADWELSAIAVTSVATYRSTSSTTPAMATICREFRELLFLFGLSFFACSKVFSVVFSIDSFMIPRFCKFSLIVACLAPVGNRARAHGRFKSSRNAKTPGLHLREARGLSWETASAAPRLRGGFRLRLADVSHRRAEPKYYFIFGTIKGGGSLTFNSLTLNPPFIHRKGNF